MGLLVIMSKGDSPLLAKGLCFRLSLSAGQIKRHYRFCQLSFDYPVSVFYNTRGLGLINTMEILSQPDLTDCVICPVKWSSVGIPQVGMLVS